MSGFDSYALLLCLIVFFVLTIVFGVMLSTIVKLTKRSIIAGFDDEKIKQDYLKELDKKDSKVFVIIEKVFNAVLGVLCVLIFSLSIVVKVTNYELTQDIPTARVVESGSMSYKNSSNKYLKENNLNDQMQVFDLIITRKLPLEMELELYDIVVYEYDGKLLIHRIVGIEEPNEKHPEVRHFLLQGDANVYPDRFPVLYTQMKAIYKGERIAYAGSIFSFFQSPAGYLCIMLILAYVFGFPFVEKQIDSVTEDRLDVILETDKEFKILIHEHRTTLVANRSKKRLEKKKR